MASRLAAPWSLHPDRALPAEPGLRAIAREIYGATRSVPVVSMHGHVDAALLADDAPFGNPAELFVTPDHYLVRQLVSQSTGPRAVPGVTGVNDLGIVPMDPSAAPAESDPREIWRRFCVGWPAFRGTATRYWLEHALIEIFGIDISPSADSADALYDDLSARLATPAMRPRALFERFGIEILATTDSAASLLPDHARLASEGWGGRIVPTFRPDDFLRLDHPDWRALVANLSASSGVAVSDYVSLLAALRQRRAAFIAAGARAADHGFSAMNTETMPLVEAERAVAAALHGEIVTKQADAFEAHMLFQMAAMSAEDGLVMQVHPGVVRGHDTAVTAAYGPNLGYDIPVAAEFTRGLRPILEAFGHHPNFRLIVFTIDETAYSRELAPLAGVYPAMRVGSPWWFLDAPDAIRRFREAVTETAGFVNTSGFVDDTRAFCSIPGRHDLSRRVDAGYLSRLVAEHRLDLDEAIDTATDLAYRLARESYPSPAGGQGLS